MCHVLDHKRVSLVAEVDDLDSGLACLDNGSQSICKSGELRLDGGHHQAGGKLAPFPFRPDDFTTYC